VCIVHLLLVLIISICLNELRIQNLISSYVICRSMMHPLSPPLVGHADSRWSQTAPLNLELLPAPSLTMSLSSWHPQLRRAAPATSLVLELCCRPPHQAASSSEGPNGSSAGLAVACYASREVIGSAGFASSTPWLPLPRHGSPVSPSGSLFLLVSYVFIIE
jgi:hypothetical protein